MWEGPLRPDSSPHKGGSHIQVVACAVTSASASADDSGRYNSRERIARSGTSALVRMPPLHFPRHDRHRVLTGRDATPGPVRIHLGELGAEKQDLRRIINPE